MSLRKCRQQNFGCRLFANKYHACLPSQHGELFCKSDMDGLRRFVAGMACSIQV